MSSNNFCRYEKCMSLQKENACNLAIMKMTFVPAKIVDPKDVSVDATSSIDVNCDSLEWSD